MVYRLSLSLYLSINLLSSPLPRSHDLSLALSLSHTHTLSLSLAYSVMKEGRYELGSQNKQWPDILKIVEKKHFVATMFLLFS